jgi:hypothetical protein
VTTASEERTRRQKTLEGHSLRTKLEETEREIKELRASFWTAIYTHYCKSSGGVVQAYLKLQASHE